MRAGCQTKNFFQGKRGFSHILLRECHTWKDYMWHPNPATRPFSQHLYNAFFHPAICSWSHHHVTPWCLQHHFLPKVAISQLSPCELRSAYQLSSTPVSLEVWHGFLLPTMPLALLQCTIKSLSFTSPYWSTFVLSFSTSLSVITTSSCPYPLLCMCPAYLPCYSGKTIFPELRWKYASQPDFSIFKLLLKTPRSSDVPEQNRLRECTTLQD